MYCICVCHKLHKPMLSFFSPLNRHQPCVFQRIYIVSWIYLHICHFQCSLFLSEFSSCHHFTSILKNSVQHFLWHRSADSKSCQFSFTCYVYFQPHFEKDIVVFWIISSWTFSPKYYALNIMVHTLQKLQIFLYSFGMYLFISLNDS